MLSTCSIETNGELVMPKMTRANLFELQNLQNFSVLFMGTYLAENHFDIRCESNRISFKTDKYIKKQRVKGVEARVVAVLYIKAHSD